MKHLGDITLIRGDEIEPVDCIIGGSPCQDLSVAGKRAGLSGARSGLFMQQIRIVKEMRKKYGKPRYMVWENVPGAFSSNRGEDFRTVLEEIVKVVDESAAVPQPPKGRWAHAGCIMGDGWSVAWRTHDAQFWGVPQRRRRIALVADFGGESAPEILFERESVSRNTESGGETREGITTNVQGSPHANDRRGYESGVIAVAFSFDSLASNSMKSSNPHSGCRQVDKAKTLDCFDPNPSKNQGGIAIVECYDARGNGDGKTCPTITGDHENRITDYTAVCVNGYDVADTLDASYYKGCGERGFKERTVVADRATVRRLTPLECERLQGYPDGWTDIGNWTDSKGKIHKAADAPRYKALGNSIALPFWLWMLRRMSEYLPAGATMGSLFDGIGGFPLCWERIHGKGSARWASEIEELPIAVTKLRFPEEEE